MRFTYDEVQHQLRKRPYQLLSGAGTVDPNAETCRYTSTGAGQALALDDGTYVGQRVRIYHAVDGGSGVLTAGGSLHLADSVASITLTNKGDWVELEWNATAWAIVGMAGVTLA